MSDREPGNWGGYPKPLADRVVELNHPVQFPHLDQLLLPVGMGRSYGDVSLNNGNTVALCSGLNAIVDFDAAEGRLVVESGTCIAEILDLVVPEGWMLPVVPGTSHVTIGGAIANDIHGKNHHSQGTFGCHVRWLDLVRSDGEYRCSRTEHADLFAATIGGLGMTGIISKAEIGLMPITSSTMQVRSIKTASLEETLDVLSENENDWPYSVAWIDQMQPSRSSGRGLVLLARHAERGSGFNRPRHVPYGDWMKRVVRPLMKPAAIKLANELRYVRQRRRVVDMTMTMDDYFHPLDRIVNWNELYRPAGMLQYQCVIPQVDDAQILHEILGLMRERGVHSYLSVVKRFGDRVSPGAMSFPMQGTTLAMDIPISGDHVFRVLNELDRIVLKVNGRIYPAKDARMSAATFKTMYPQYTLVSKHKDPRITSTFWERVTRPTH